MMTSFFGSISVVAVTIAFIGLVIWAYSPSRKQQFEKHGHIPLEDDRAEEKADE